jgi:hypothetical protein
MMPPQTAPQAVPAVPETPWAAVQPGQSTGSTMPANAIAAVAAGFLAVILAATVGLYVYFSLCMYLIARKLNVPAAWTAWLPILQVWPFLGSAGKSLWWAILLLIPLVNVFVGVFLWMRITENLGRNSMLGVLMLLPVVNLVLLGVLAFSGRDEASAKPVPAF